jgi:cytochrome b561
MASTRDASSYGRTAKAFHWTVALLIVLMFVLGWTMDAEQRHSSHITAVDFHMTIGVVIMALVVLRYVWRRRNPPPPLPAHMSRLERLVAECGHAALYLLTFAIPAAGLIMVVVEGEAVLFFGLIDLDSEGQRSEEAAEIFADLHKWSGWALLAVLAGHVAAALRHHFLLRDDVLRRMLPSASSYISGVKPTRSGPSDSRTGRLISEG